MVRTVAGFRALPAGARAAWQEWAVAQELWRRAAIRGDEMPEEQSYWRSDDHEVDFVLAPDEFLETKLGPTNPMEFAWFSRVFPKGRLTVVSQSTYETRHIRGIRMEDFLAE
jgi:hypothetical protein